ncbi:YchJ family metal-binding protein [Candidatus Fukatsuia endosymbiont of Tuberolachnus salignus]|uniref:YchJ family metal-binding protein n=1 Tax=Candidatus Fukatsuia endosymbiont of Tuberolachnus salignus TaxID=3077957 RepID=UPI00313D5792
MSELCPCGSILKYNVCCEPYVIGEKIASSPGILMRSRYSAYVKHNVDYLIISWHPDCHAEKFRAMLMQCDTEWHGLIVIKEMAGSHTDEGFVEFCAGFTDRNTTKTSMIYECSRFLRLKKRWYYVDGISKYSR